MFKHFARKAASSAAVLCLAATAQAGAQVTTYSAHDAGASTAGANSQAGQASFITATGGSVGIDFESATYPSGVSVVFASPYGATGRKNAPSCPTSLCGGNTTSGGSYFGELFGGSATFTFLNPISYFGAYFGGLQQDNTITFVDGSSETVHIPYSGSGFSFTGFTSEGLGIASVTVNAGGDIMSVDDVIFGASGEEVAPEPASLVLVATGLIGVVGYAKRRKNVK